MDMYKERYIAFIDILGFKDIIHKTYKSEIEFKRLKDTIEYIDFLRKRNYESPLGAELSKTEFSLFSDSIVLSYPDGSPFSILFEISSLCVELIDRGYIFRGGITFGPLIHEGQICYGPAMNRVVALEKQAQYPRVMVEPIVVQRGIKYPVLYGDSVREERAIKRDLCIEGKEMFLDYLGQAKRTMGQKDYICFMKNVRECIFSGLMEIVKKINICSNNIENLKKMERVREKYIWLSRYYNNTIEKCLGIQELLIDYVNV